MSYSFIDTTELQNIEQLLPEEALQFNGEKMLHNRSLVP